MFNNLSSNQKYIFSIAFITLSFMLMWIANGQNTFVNNIYGGKTKVKKSWIRTKGGLYINDKNQVAIAVFIDTAQGRKKLFLTHPDNSEIRYKSIIDINSFKNLGHYNKGVFDQNVFCVDKNHVYFYMNNSSGGNLKIVKFADKETLHAINSAGYFYADKKNIYSAYTGFYLEGADKESFVASSNTPFGRDKHSYYTWWGRKIHKSILKESIVRELDQLFYKAMKERGEVQYLVPRLTGE